MEKEGEKWGGGLQRKGILSLLRVIVGRKQGQKSDRRAEGKGPGEQNLLMQGPASYIGYFGGLDYLDGVKKSGWLTGCKEGGMQDQL